MTNTLTSFLEALCLEAVRPNVTPARALMARDFYCDPNAGFTLKLPRSHSLSRDPAPPRKVLRRAAHHPHAPSAPRLAAMSSGTPLPVVEREERHPRHQGGASEPHTSVLSNLRSVASSWES